jgi:hypothetical protein
MDCNEVRDHLGEIQFTVSKVTAKSDADQLIELSDHVGNLLALLDEERHDVIGEQMLEEFWRFTLAYYFYPHRKVQKPIDMPIEEMSQCALMRVSVLRLYGDMYGDVLEPEARTICVAIKKGCKYVLDEQSKTTLHSRAQSKPGFQKTPLKLVVNN